jgi:hypothetical protein
MRTFSIRSLRPAGLATLSLSLATSTLFAQLPSASTAGFAMAGNYSAMARGYEAVALNPANLAMPGRPFLSLGALALGGTLGLDPVDFKALHEWSGLVVDSATRVDWVDQARLSGGEKIRLDGGVTYLGLSVGPIGIQAGSSFYSSLNLSPDAFEAVLFGNAGRNNLQPKTLDFTGTSVRAGAFSTGAASFAMGLPFKLMGGTLPNEKMTIGVTGKYVIGHGLVLAEDLGSSFGASDMQLRFPTIGVRSSETVAPLGADEYKGIAGTGMAGDIAVAWNGGPLRVGVLAENVFNAFKWDTTMLSFMPGTGAFDGTSNTTDFDQQPFTNAPQALKDLVTSQKFTPAISIGAAFKLTSRLTLTADMKTVTGGDEAIVIGPKSRYGVGMEFRYVPFIPIRAGVASVTDGWQAGVGAGIHILGLEIGGATSIRRRGAATESGVMLGVIGIGR